MGCACSGDGKNHRYIQNIYWKHRKQSFRKLSRPWQYGIHIKDFRGEDELTEDHIQ